MLLPSPERTFSITQYNTSARENRRVLGEVPRSPPTSQPIEEAQMRGIYEIRCVTTDKRYIGRAVDTESRWKEHRKGLVKGKHHCKPLQRAWIKYGESSFKFIVIESVDVKGELKKLEQRYLDEFLSLGELYNTSPFACGGTKPGKDHPCYGTHLSEEHCNKISAANTGSHHTEEACRKIGDAKKGQNNPNYGKQTWNAGKLGIYSDKYRQKLSEAAAKPYPAFFNEKTGEFIPAGKNLWGLCKEQELNYCNMWNVKTIPNRVTRDGWRIA